MKTIITIILTCTLSLSVGLTISQEFKLIDSINISFDGKTTELFLYKRFPSFVKKNFTDQQELEFIMKNADKFIGPTSFSNYFGNTLFTIITKNNKELAHDILFANDLSLFGTKTNILGEFLFVDNQLFYIMCRSVLENFTFAVIKSDIKHVIGEFPNCFDSLKIEHWPIPTPTYSEINIKEYTYIKSIKVFQSNNEIIVYTEKDPIGNYDYLYKYYLFNIKKKQWYKAKPQAEIIETDSTYHLSKQLLKLPEIEKSDTLVKVIDQLSKQLLKQNCDIGKLQAIKEEETILFFVEYKKRCEPVFLQYNIKEKEWFKVEFEKEEIKSD